MDVNQGTNGAEPPDAVLLRRFLDGDEQAFRVLYRRHTPRLRMVVLRLLAHRDSEADDVVQETWILGCRGLREFRGEAQFGTWLTTIGIRTARNRLRFTNKDGEELSENTASADAASLEDTMDVERALTLLPDQLRAVVVLHDIEGFTHEEIAAQLGFAVGTSRSTLSRARVAMRRYWNGDAQHD